MRFRGISPSMVVAIVALVAATAGTALAATGTIVNIADPDNAANVAKVDSAGAMRVTSRPLAPTAPVNVVRDLPNFYGPGGDYVQVLRSTSTMAITRLVFTNNVQNANAWEAFVFYERVDANGNCSEFSSSHRLVTHAVVPGRDSFSDPMPSPIVLKPPTAGATWCLLVGAGPASSADHTQNSGVMRVAVSGWLEAGGTFTSGQATREREKPNRRRLGG